MPPQPGLFSVSKGRSNHADIDMHNVAGPSSRAHGDVRKEKKSKNISGRLNREMNNYRDDARAFAESISALHAASIQLSSRPDSAPLYLLRLLPLSQERSALITQIDIEERYALECIQTAHDEELERVESEWEKGKDAVRERLMEGIEERRKRAREEKEGEGTVGDAALDSQSRPHITRKLRNKMGGGSGAASPPATPINGYSGYNGVLLSNGTMNGAYPQGSNPSGGIAAFPITSGPFLNPHSLSVDELPSPFPIPLTSSEGGVSSGTGQGHSSYGPQGGTSGAGGAGGAGGQGAGKRRPKGTTNQSQSLGGLGKSIGALQACKDMEIEADLGEIRRGNKRRRAAAVSLNRTNVVS